MFKFLKKLFGCAETTTESKCPVAPYKVEGPLGVPAVNPQITDAVTAKPPVVKLRQPGTPKQGARKPAQGKKPQGAKPVGQKPATQKKPAQPKPQGAKPAGNKPRGRRPKAKPSTPQQ